MGTHIHYRTEDISDNRYQKMMRISSHFVYPDDLGKYFCVVEVFKEKPLYIVGNVLVINQSNYDQSNSCGTEIDYTQEVKNSVLTELCNSTMTTMASTASSLANDLAMSAASSHGGSESSATTASSSSLGSESAPEPTTDYETFCHQTCTVETSVSVLGTLSVTLIFLTIAFLLGRTIFLKKKESKIKSFCSM